MGLFGLQWDNDKSAGYGEPPAETGAVSGELAEQEDVRARQIT